ncbi:hypothetical protein PQG02_24000 [Nostoc sp. UHCC 0926]|nr:hypothetical protein [Nostoc sp. UHCC 0926]WDD31729.1 hypothetical protein PQG02_24000 [Nostoc sp. UHCC 0926]
MNIAIAGLRQVLDCEAIASANTISYELYTLPLLPEDTGVWLLTYLVF